MTQAMSQQRPSVCEFLGTSSCDWHWAAYAPTGAHGEFTEDSGQLAGFTGDSLRGALESTCGSARVGARGRRQHAWGLVTARLSGSFL